MDVASALDPSFWQKLCPQLTVAGPSTEDRAAKRFKTVQRNPLPRDAVITDGFWPTDELLGKVGKYSGQEAAHILADATETIMKAGYPPTFLLVYQEVWDIMRDVLAETAQCAQKEGLAPNCDILIFHVSPIDGSQEDVATKVAADKTRLPFSLPHGFSPHRDRQPEHAPASFTATGFPKYLTMWMALTNATPHNSCLYMIPAWADPGYIKGDLRDDIDPMSAALSSKESYQHIRAFPLPPGGAVLFSHRTLHWGSQGTSKSPNPRIALSFAFSTPDYEPCYLTPDGFAAARDGDHATRVRLAAAQCICYQDRFLFAKNDLKTLYNVANHQVEENDIFTGTYKAKYLTCFTQGVGRVVKGGFTTAEGAEAGSAPVAAAEEDEDDSDLEDAMLSALLDAEAGGAEVEEDFEESDEEDEEGLA